MNISITYVFQYLYLDLSISKTIISNDSSVSSSVKLVKIEFFKHDYSNNTLFTWSFFIEFALINSGILNNSYHNNCSN